MARDIEMVIREREEELSRLNDEETQLQVRLSAITDRRSELAVEIEALHKALAIMQEHVEAEPVRIVVVERDAEQERVREELENGARARHEAEELARQQEEERQARRKAVAEERHPRQRPATGDRKGVSKSGLELQHRERSPERPKGAGKGVPRPKRYLNPATVEQYPKLAWENLTDLERERAELVIMILEDGEASQYQIAAQLMELIAGCDTMQTGQTITSEIIQILQVNKLVIWTGEKAKAASNRRTSPIWKLAANASPQERAAAGLPCNDDNYAGTTSRWPVGGQQPGKGTRITVESSQFEGKR